MMTDIINKREQAMNDTIYRQDVINVLKGLSACEEYGVEVGTDEETYIGKYEAITVISDLPSADVPQGDVDAVAIFEREMHNLERGYITIGEFDERIEPLRHLYYGRPQGEWIMSKPEEEGFGAVFQCSQCSYEVDYVPTNFCPNCGVRMKETRRWQ